MKNEKTFIISDTHFNHSNIINFCKRPFKDVHEMNEALIANWNKVVGKNDTVYFLGDFCYETKDKKTDYWLSRLNGHIIWVKGNHDHQKGLIEKIHFYDMMMIHDAWGLGVGHGICIHGHQHDKGKLFDKRHKRICVSAELLNYTPIELNVLLTRYRNEK